MKKIQYHYFIIYILLVAFSKNASAQTGNSVFDFLKLPTSSKAAALGGTNISTIENNPSMVFQNPGFLGPEMDKGLSVSYLAYLADINAGSVIYTKAAGENAAWGIGVNYVNYGNIKETTTEDIYVGDFSLNDICVNGFYSHDLSDKIRGGIATKIIYSSYAGYTSVGLGVDLGLSYYDSENDFSLGLTAKNLGGQIKSYYGERSAMPWDIQLGITKKLAKAPIRFSLTGVSLNNWKTYGITGKKDDFGTCFIKHFIFGVDFIPSDNFWLGIGYNVKTGTDLKLTEGNKMGGFSIGAGINVKEFTIGTAISQYHPSATSFMFTVSTVL